MTSMEWQTQQQRTVALARLVGERRALTPLRMAIFTGAGLVALWFVLAGIFGLFGCATLPTPRGIAANLNACLRSRTQFAPHLALACECVERAEAECQRQGLDRWCAWNGWDDQDRDSWTIGACLQRQAGRGP